MKTTKLFFRDLRIAYYTYKRKVTTFLIGILNPFFKIIGITIISEIKCPRVEKRICCDKCNYPLSESLYMDYVDAGLKKDVLCKYDLLT